MTGRIGLKFPFLLLRPRVWKANCLIGRTDHMSTFEDLDISVKICMV